MKNIALTIIFFYCLIFIVEASQPSLPTTIYGLVTDSQGNTRSGIQVSALWTDTQGEQQSVVTTSLSESQAQNLGDPNLAGQFIFGDGYIVASEGTEIRLIVDGIYYRSVNANPGQSIGGNTIVIGADQQPTNQEQAVDAGGANQGTEASGAGGNIPLPEGFGESSQALAALPSAQTPSEIGEEGQTGDTVGSSTGEGEYEGSGTDGEMTFGDLLAMKGLNPGDHNQPLTDEMINELSLYSQSQLRELAEKAETEEIFADGTTAGQLAPLLYGQVFDIDGDPLEGEEITVTWTDEEGKPQQESVTTLTEEQARELGNPDLAGYYKFDREHVKEGSAVLFSIKEEQVSHVFASTDNSEEVDIHTQVTKSGFSFGSILNVSAVGPSFIERTSDWFWLLVLGAVIVGLVVLLKRRKHVVREEPKHTDITSIYHSKAKTYMENAVCIEENQSILDGLSSMITEGSSVIVTVRYERLRGMVSASTILNAYAQNEHVLREPISSIAVSPVVTSVQGDQTQTIIDLMIKHKVEHIPIVKDAHVKGMVSTTQILGQFTKFFESHNVSTESPPIVKSCYSAHVGRCDADDLLLEVYHSITEDDAQCSVVYETRKVGEKVGRQAVGVISTTTLLEELYKNPTNLSQLKAKHVMETPLSSITPGCYLLDAQKMMIHKHYRQLPVLLDNKIVGVVRQKDILRELHEVLERYRPHKRGLLGLLRRKTKGRTQPKPLDTSAIHPKHA